MKSIIAALLAASVLAWNECETTGCDQCEADEAAGRDPQQNPNSCADWWLCEGATEEQLESNRVACEALADLTEGLEEAQDELEDAFAALDEAFANLEDDGAAYLTTGLSAVAAVVAVSAF